MTPIKFPKRQHYIPQFYLKNFSQDKKRVYIYDKNKGEKEKIRYQTTLKIAHQNNFYTFRSKKGGKENLEKVFSAFEGKAASIIQKVRNQKQISESDKEKLALFVAFQDTRTPAFKKRTEAMHTQMGEKIARMSMRMTSDDTLKKFFKKKKGKEMTEIEIKDLKNFATNPKRSKIAFKYPNGWWIRIMLETGMATVPAFMTMDWFFLYTSQPYAFITNDKPLMIVPPKDYDKFWGIGLLTPGVRRIIPLSADLCLMMGEMRKNPSIKFIEADKKFFREVNTHLVLESERFCFSPDKGKLEKLVKEQKQISNKVQQPSVQSQTPIVHS